MAELGGVVVDASCDGLDSAGYRVAQLGSRCAYVVGGCLRSGFRRLSDFGSDIFGFCSGFADIGLGCRRHHGATFATFFTVGMARVATRLAPAGKGAKRSTCSATSTALSKVSAYSAAVLIGADASCEGSLAALSSRGCESEVSGAFSSMALLCARLKSVRDHCAESNSQACSK